MGQFDLKNAIVSFVDGRLAALTTTAGAGINARLLLTDVNRHRGTQPAVRIALIVAGLNTPLSISVTGTDITVNVATDGAGAATSTAAQVRTALLASGPAAALVTPTLPGTGAGIVSAQAFTALTSGARTFAVKVAEGVVTYAEKKNRKYTMDRGKLGTVMNADEVPLDVKINGIWEFLTDSAALTFEDVLKQRNFASNWTSTDPDQCQPYCVDVEIAYNPNCGVLREFITLQLFRYEDIGHGLKDGVLDVSGRCNVTEAALLRVT